MTTAESQDVGCQVTYKDILTSTGDPRPLRHRSSKEWLPPYMSELRVVLLGNSWSVRGPVGNLVLGENLLNTEEEPVSCLRVTVKKKNRDLVVINSPDLLHPNISEDKLTEHVKNCVSLSDPGPHVFLLVLQPEDFTEEHRLRLLRVLRLFGDDSLDHSLLLISTCREESSETMEDHLQHPPLQDMIRRCRYRYLRQKNLERPELLTRLGNAAKKDSAESLSCDVSGDRTSFFGDDELQSRNALRIVLLGKAGAGKSTSGNTILGRDEFEAEPSGQAVTEYFQKAKCEVNSRPVVVVNTPGLFDTILSCEEVNTEIGKCIRLMSPGPHVFLLVLRIGKFTKAEKETIELIRKVFGEKYKEFIHILLTGGDTLKRDKTSIDEYIENKCDESFKNLIDECEGRIHVFDNRDKGNHRQVEDLVDKIEQMVRKNGGGCYTNEMFQNAKQGIKIERILKKKEEEMRKEREDLQRQHDEELKAMKERMEEERAEIEKERKQLSAQKEQSLRETVADLQDKHKQEVTDLILQLLTQKKNYSREVTEMKKTHLKEREELEKHLTETQQRQHGNEKMQKLLRRQEEEMTKFRQKVLNESEEREKEEIQKLQRKHEQEMNELKDRLVQDGRNPEESQEMEELQKKHKIEIVELKDKLLGIKDSSCSIS